MAPYGPDLAPIWIKMASLGSQDGFKMRLWKRPEGEYHDTRVPDPFRDRFGSPGVAPDGPDLVPIWIKMASLGSQDGLKMRLWKRCQGEYHDTRIPNPFKDLLGSPRVAPNGPDLAPICFNIGLPVGNRKKAFQVRNQASSAFLFQYWPACMQNFASRDAKIKRGSLPILVSPLWARKKTQKRRCKH